MQRWAMVVTGGVVGALGAVAVAVSTGQEGGGEAEAFCRAMAAEVDPVALGSDPSTVRAMATFVVGERAVAGAPDDWQAEVGELRRGLVDAVDSPDGTLADADGWVRRYAAVRDGTRGSCAG